MPFTPYTLPISLNAVATGGGGTSKSMSGLRGKTIYDSGGTSYTTPSSGPFSLKDNFLNRSFTTFPGSPTNLTPTAGNAQATLSWSAPTNNGGSDITGYTVKYSNGTAIATTGAGTTSYTVTGLTNGTSYTFMVTANNIVGSSAPSSTVSVTPVNPSNNIYFSKATVTNPQTPGSSPSILTSTPQYTISYTLPFRLVNGYIPSNDTMNFEMTGGNSSPVYITFYTSGFDGQTTVILNNVNYGNDGNLSVYFPYGINSTTGSHKGAPNGGSLTISQSRPTEGYLSRRCQNASGNNITCP